MFVRVRRIVVDVIAAQHEKVGVLGLRQTQRGFERGGGKTGLDVQVAQKRDRKSIEGGRKAANRNRDAIEDRMMRLVERAVRPGSSRRRQRAYSQPAK